MASSYRDILTPQWLKDRFLVGIDLTDDQNDPFPEFMYTHAIDTAIRQVEGDVSIVLDPVTFKRERHDGYSRDRDNYWLFRLSNRPVISVDKARLAINKTDITTLPDDWIYVDNPIHGRVGIVVSVEGVQQYITEGGVPFFYSLFTHRDKIPGYFLYDYKAGFPFYSGTYTVGAGLNPLTELALSPEAQRPDYFVNASITEGSEADKLIDVCTMSRATDEVGLQLASAPVGEVTVTWSILTAPTDLLHLVGLKASQMALATAGDLIAGAGVASQSVSVDGLSQSVQTTSSPTNSGYGARSLQFGKMYDNAVRSVRARFRMPGLSIF